MYKYIYVYVCACDVYVYVHVYTCTHLFICFLFIYKNLILQRPWALYNKNWHLLSIRTYANNTLRKLTSLKIFCS